MSKEARPGELRTRITIQALTEGIDAGGFQTKEWTDLFGGKKVWCKWANPHGTEVYEQMKLELRDPATITMRYTPLIDQRCRVFKGYTPVGDQKKDDRHAYEIISIDNVLDRNKIMEIKVQRMVKA